MHDAHSRRHLRCLSEQDLEATRHAELEVRPVSLADAVECQAARPRQVRTERALAAFILVGLAALIAIAGLQWAAGLTDDVRAARAACEVRR